MRISNEMYLKRLIVGGYERIFEFSPDFRNEGIDRVHNPEFTQVETMWAYADYKDNMQFAEDMISSVVKKIHGKTNITVGEKVLDFKKPWRKLRFLDAIREVGLGRKVKFYQASTSELFGKVHEVPQNENTPFYPRSPYGVAKLYGFWIVKNYREAYNLFAANGILFNHESPRRGETFVTRKITRAAARIVLGLQEKLLLGNLNAKRDWGFAPEYCEGMWRILQQEEPEDFVLATGEAHTVREFCDLAFGELGIELEWSGENENEKGIVKTIRSSELLSLEVKKRTMNSESRTPNSEQSTLNLEAGTVIIEINQNYFRPTEVDLLIGNPKKAKEKLKWEAKTKFEDLVKLMAKEDFKKVLKRGF